MTLPFATASYDRVLMFDVVEHLYPWELQQALAEVNRVLKPNGRFIVHTAPNVWYDRYAYPLVRFVRRLMGQGDRYPANPREFLVGHNVHVHVNEQSQFSLHRALTQAGFQQQGLAGQPAPGLEQQQARPGAPPAISHATLPLVLRAGSFRRRGQTSVKRPERKSCATNALLTS